MENESTGQEMWNKPENYKWVDLNIATGIWIADPSRGHIELMSPIFHKPSTWAEKMKYKLVVRAIRKQTFRNKWIVYTVSTLSALLGMSIAIILAFVCYHYLHSSNPFFGIIAVEFGIIGWMLSKEYIEKLFPIGDWETMRFKRTRHGVTKTYY